MEPFTCRKCDSQTWKLLLDGCPNCVSVKNARNPNLHQKVNPAKPNMTYADKMRIVTRTQGKDGVFRAAPPWRHNGI